MCSLVSDCQRPKFAAEIKGKRSHEASLLFLGVCSLISAICLAACSNVGCVGHCARGSGSLCKEGSIIYSAASVSVRRFSRAVMYPVGRPLRTVRHQHPSTARVSNNKHLPLILLRVNARRVVRTKALCTRGSVERSAPACIVLDVCCPHIQHAVALEAVRIVGRLLIGATHTLHFRTLHFSQEMGLRSMGTML